MAGYLGATQLCFVPTPCRIVALDERGQESDELKEVQVRARAVVWCTVAGWAGWARH
jgi:hypothetical protein